ncbi:TetR/AcrR family transcriptional regulator [Prosthecobacter algae]|uniref:TetR/AcrR family transcriptional regulator n=1 Tax=Prosthecobacter algae TaxID=1144682 RepID=A0ABP9NTI3_9BACT
MKKELTPPAVGRPRAFDPDVALEKAMQVFWKHGYEGTSLSDLTEAMGINRPSLYATYGNKEQLFIKVLDRYGSGPVAYVLESLNEPTVRGVIEKMLQGSVCLLSDPQHPRGCMALQGMLCGGKDSAFVLEHARARRVAAQEKIRERFERARKEGDLTLEVNAGDLARHLAMLLNGLSIQASNGASAKELKRAVEFALKTLPV